MKEYLSVLSCICLCISMFCFPAAAIGKNPIEPGIVVIDGITYVDSLERIAGMYGIEAIPYGTSGNLFTLRVCVFVSAVSTITDIVMPAAFSWSDDTYTFEFHGQARMGETVFMYYPSPIALDPDGDYWVTFRDTYLRYLDYTDGEMITTVCAAVSESEPVIFQ